MIFSDAREKYTEYIYIVLERFRKIKLFIKLFKYKFTIEKINFLGFYIGIVGISMDFCRIIIIIKWLTPKSFHDIIIFLNFVNFYRGFIYRYLAEIIFIINLLKGLENSKKKRLFI